MPKVIVYIAHPISGDIENNLKDIIRILRIINTNSHSRAGEFYSIIPDSGMTERPFEFSDIIPQAPYYADILALDDTKPLERKRGIENGIAMLESRVYQELWLTGDKISLGMQEEIKIAKLLGIPVVNYINKF